MFSVTKCPTRDSVVCSHLQDALQELALYVLIYNMSY